MLTPQDLGRRLRYIRERAGITQDAAANVLGLDNTAITKVEAGKRGLGALELMRLAVFYKIDINDLLKDVFKGEAVQLRIAMRANTALDPKTSLMQNRLQQIISDDRWLRHELATHFLSNPPLLWDATQTDSSFFRLSAQDKGYQGAKLFRERHSLTSTPIPNVEILADELGVLVCRLPLSDYQSPDGCSAVDPIDGTAYILINSDKPRSRRRFTIAHELGHLALGHLHKGEIVLDETTSSTLPAETEANAFAAELLMPEEGVKALLERLRNRLGEKAQLLELIVWLAASFGVSEEAVTYRILNLRIDNVPAQETTEALKTVREHPEAVKQVRARLGLAPVMSDTERGITEVGPVMRSRIALALEKGLINVERAAEIMHVPLTQTYRWVVETGLNVEEKFK